jgi:hypothetical protein
MSFLWRVYFVELAFETLFIMLFESNLMISHVACDPFCTEPQKRNYAAREELSQVTCVVPTCLSSPATGRWNQNSWGANVCTIVSGTRVTQNMHGCPVLSSVLSSCCHF